MALTRLENVLNLTLSIRCLLEDAKNGANRDKAINVGGTVQRIKSDNVFAWSWKETLLPKMPHNTKPLEPCLLMSTSITFSSSSLTIAHT